MRQPRRPDVTLLLPPPLPYALLHHGLFSSLLPILDLVWSWDPRGCNLFRTPCAKMLNHLDTVPLCHLAPELDFGNLLLQAHDALPGPLLGHPLSVNIDACRGLIAAETQHLYFELNDKSIGLAPRGELQSELILELGVCLVHKVYGLVGLASIREVPAAELGGREKGLVADMHALVYLGIVGGVAAPDADGVLWTHPDVTRLLPPPLPPALIGRDLVS